MFTAGWAGLTAGWLPRLTFHASHFTFCAPRNTESKTQSGTHLDVLILCIFGFIWGLLYGAIINIYFWPFAVGPAAQTWAPGIGLGETLARYGVFYAVTSLSWDLARAVGNVALILVLGAPMIKALERFRRRFNFQVGGMGEETALTTSEAKSHA
jgi:energy-coupling factor transport system substrate-specific component